MFSILSLSATSVNRFIPYGSLMILDIYCILKRKRIISLNRQFMFLVITNCRFRVLNLITSYYDYIERVEKSLKTNPR